MLLSPPLLDALLAMKQIVNWLGFESAAKLLTPNKGVRCQKFFIFSYRLDNDHHHLSLFLFCKVVEIIVNYFHQGTVCMNRTQQIALKANTYPLQQVRGSHLDLINTHTQKTQSFETRW